MIRINLLSEGRRPAAVRKTRSGKFTEREDAASILLFSLIAFGLLVGGLWWWITRGQLADVKEDVAVAQQEVDKLQEVLQEINRFEAKKAEIKNKIDVISDLKANQRGPVRTMDQMSSALPELLWLDQMRIGASDINVSGRAFNVNAVANFIENLERVPEFREAVQPKLDRQDNVYRFTFSFPYSYTAPTPIGEGEVEGTDQLAER
jgi:type IV pilus assembly protein PilN